MLLYTLSSLCVIDRPNIANVKSFCEKIIDLFIILYNRKDEKVIIDVLL